MKNFPSLKSNNEFKMVYNKGKSYANKYLVMYILKNGTDTNKIGISVSKKVGNSIVRHRITRVIREIFRLNEIKEGFDIVIIARIMAKDTDYNDLESAYIHLCKLHKLTK